MLTCAVADSVLRGECVYFDAWKLRQLIIIFINYILLDSAKLQYISTHSEGQARTDPLLLTYFIVFGFTRSSLSLLPSMTIYQQVD